MKRYYEENMERIGGLQFRQVDFMIIRHMRNSRLFYRKMTGASYTNTIFPRQNGNRLS